MWALIKVSKIKGWGWWLGTAQLCCSSGESMSAGGDLGLSSGRRSELFKMTVPLNENSLAKWEGEVQHGLKNLPQELDQYVKACPQSTFGK